MNQLLFKMNRITENTIEAFAIELLDKLGYEYIYAPDIAPDTSTGSMSDIRESYAQVLLLNRLQKAVKKSELPDVTPDKLIEAAFAAKMITTKDVVALQMANRLRQAVIAVDDFDSSEL